MAVLDKHQTVAAPFALASEMVVVEYDFAVDGGSIADYDVITADGNLLVELLNIDVEAAITGAGCVMDLGKGAGGTEFKSDLAVATTLLDAQIAADTPGTIVELADGEKIVFGIEVGASTAGKVQMMFKVYKRH